MKKRITRWLIASAAVLAIGIASFRFAPGRQDDATQRMIETKVATAVATRDPVPQPVNSVSGAATNFEFLEERQTLLENGDVEARRLVKRADKYPYRIVVETLRKDLDLKKFIPSGAP